MDNEIINQPTGEVGQNADGQEVAELDAPTATTNQPAAEERIAPAATAHDDFDWSIDKRNVSSLQQRRKRKV